jgi:Tir chaperone protein (CesT) family
MRTVRDVEAYLESLGRSFEAVPGKDGTFLLRSRDNRAPIALRVDPPLVIARLAVGAIPEGDSTVLLKALLEMNASALVHTSFGLEGSQIVLSAALELANLDLNELEAVLDEIDMTLAQELPKLHKML